MNKIIVLGNSPAAVKAIENIRAHDKESSIFIIAHDGSYPYKREIFSAVIAKEASVEDIYYRDKKFYKDHHIEVILDKTVTRINFKRKKIFTEQKEQYAYDQLILAELPDATKLTDIKGGHKEGVYSLRKIKYIDKLIKEVPLIDVIAIQSHTPAGLQAAAALLKLNKEIYLLSTNDNAVKEIQDHALKNYIETCIHQEKLHCVNDTIEEILGDTVLKAVKLNTGKVLGCQAVILGELPENLKLLDDAHINVEDAKVKVDDYFRTSLQDVYAVDALVEHTKNDAWHDFVSSEYLEQQGHKCAEGIRLTQQTFS